MSFSGLSGLSGLSGMVGVSAPPPAISLSAIITGLVATVTVTNIGGAYTSISFAASDDSPVVTGTGPYTLTFTSAGIFTIRATATNSAGSSSASTTPQSVGFAVLITPTTYLSSTDAGLPSGSNPVSCSFWFNASSIPTSTQQNLVTFGTDAFPYGRAFQVAIYNNMLFQTYGMNQIFAGAISANNWFHVVATLDGSGNADLYVNGTSVGTSTGTPNITLSGVFGIGASSASGRVTVPIEIASVGIWNRVLTGTEITSLYEEGILGAFYSALTSGLKSGLVRWYDCNQYVGNQIIDAVGSGSNLSQTGTVVLVPRDWPPNVSFTYTVSSLVATVTIINTGGYFTTPSWTGSTGSPTIAGSGTTYTFTYSGAGTYTIELTATNGSGSSAFSDYVVIGALFAYEPSRGGSYIDNAYTTPAIAGQSVGSVNGMGTTGAVVTGSGMSLQNTANRLVLQCTKAGYLAVSGTLADYNKFALLVVHACLDTTVESGLMGITGAPFGRFTCSLYFGSYNFSDFDSTVTYVYTFNTTGTYPTPSQGFSDLTVLHLEATGGSLQRNGTQIATIAGPIVAGLSPVSTIRLLADDTGASANYFYGNIQALYILSSPTDAEVTALSTALVARYSPSSIAPPITSQPIWIVDGNSIAYGNNCTLSINQYARTAALGLTSPPLVWDLGTPSMQTAQNQSRFASLVAPLYNSDRRYNAYSIQEGTNSILNGVSAASIIASYIAIGEAALAVPFNPVIIIAIPPGLPYTTAQEAVREAVNSQFQSDFNTPFGSSGYVFKWSGSGTQYGHYMVRVDLINNLTNPANTTYWEPTGIHWLSTGHALVAPVIETIFDGL